MERYIHICLYIPSEWQLPSNEFHAKYKNNASYYLKGHSIALSPRYIHISQLPTYIYIYICIEGENDAHICVSSFCSLV